ncbi:hypothetical protein D9Q98_003232 [Chlorella vulgaris]|uniref:Chitin-binding type-2 domain-containing protein n=1 Tax=Chlorella vulgaris TaxID=3077 RepID=A0A9D4TSC6_CHLVU|nr:hypothetical protein D9Q98_003232 [Chlorella vulgaris]
MPLPCPHGTVEYNNVCYDICKAPQTKAANRPDLCMKPCTGTLTSGDGAAVPGSTKCIRCPDASPDYVLATNRCYPTCASGSAVGPLCCGACPSWHLQHNATHCIKNGVRPPAYSLRSVPCQGRAAAIPTKQTSRLVSTTSTDKRCPDGETLIGTDCVACPEGFSLDEAVHQDGTSELQCRTPQFCYGDTVSCGGFCVSTEVFQASRLDEFIYDEQCDTAFGQLPSSCYVGCGSSVDLPYALPASPVCPAVVAQQDPSVYPAPCPTGATEHLGSCYMACESPSIERSKRPDQCLRACNGTRTSGEGAVVQGSANCIRCPDASPDYVLATNRCYPTCASGELAVRELCCPPCPAGSSQLNATHCFKPNTTPRVYVQRSSTCEARSPPVPVQHITRIVDKVAVARDCGGDATLINGQCYACPSGQQLDASTSQSGDTPQLQCISSTGCTDGEVLCGGFCIETGYFNSAGFQGDDQCSAIFGQLSRECLVGCDLRGVAPVPSSPPPPPPSPSPEPESTGCQPSDATCVCTTPSPRTGLYADQSSGCTKYYQCSGPGQYFRRDCGPGLQFSNALQGCDFPANVQCTTDAPRPTPPPPPSSDSGGSSGGSGSGGGGGSGSGGSGGSSGGGGSSDGVGVGRYLTQALWDTMFRNINNPACTGANFYSYDAFVAATKVFPDFANSGSDEVNRRELAAFLAQISHEVTGGPATNNQYDWGLCWKVELCVYAGNDKDCAPYCDPTLYSCPPGRKYYGRGPIQLSWNYNYAQAGAALGLDLLNNPGLVSTNASVAFQTALWFWTAPQTPKPSCHDVMAGRFTPAVSDISAGRVPGFGLTTNIINGGLECNQPTTPAVWDRINYFTRYTALLGTPPGANLECSAQRSYS